MVDAVQTRVVPPGSPNAAGSAQTGQDQASDRTAVSTRGGAPRARDVGRRRRPRQNRSDAERLAKHSLPSDLSESEWERLAPLIPPAKPGGRPRKTDMRAA